MSPTGTEAFERALSELSQARPDEFVLVRSRLERDLKDAGDAAGAAELRRRRRPHLAAWAANQLAHREPDAIEELMAATAEAADAQRAALRGEDADQLRTGARARQEALEHAADLAVSMLKGVAPDPSAYRDNVVATLDAASVDPDAAAELRAGLLTKPLRAPAGFDLGATTMPEVAPSKSKARERDRAQREVVDARADVEARTAAADELDAELASAELHANSTSLQVDEVEQALERAREASRAAAAAVAETRARLEAGQRAVRQAAERLRQAEERLAALDQ